jgi:hypothetical protein
MAARRVEANGDRIGADPGLTKPLRGAPVLQVPDAPVVIGTERVTLLLRGCVEKGGVSANYSYCFRSKLLVRLTSADIAEYHAG